MATIKVKPIAVQGRTVNAVEIPATLQCAVNDKNEKTYTVKTLSFDSSKVREGQQPNQMSVSEVIGRVSVLANPATDNYNELVNLVLSDIGLERA